MGLIFSCCLMKCPQMERQRAAPVSFPKYHCYKANERQDMVFQELGEEKTFIFYKIIIIVGTFCGKTEGRRKGEKPT